VGQADLQGRLEARHCAPGTAQLVPLKLVIMHAPVWDGLPPRASLKVSQHF
jgi:hypothetical protein